MKSKKKKPAKAITLLTQIETLLSDVLDELSVIEKSVEKNVRELLVSAEASISKAKDFISLSPSPVVRHKAVTRQRGAKTTAKRPARAKKLSTATVH